MKSIKLAVNPLRGADGKKTYRVITVKNSVDYDPGMELCRDEVSDLCRNAAWDVTIVGHKEAGAAA